MGKFSDMRKKQLEARGAAPSVRPPAAAPQVEPIVPAQPVAPVAPTEAPAAPAPKAEPAPAPSVQPVAPSAPVAPATPKAPVSPTMPSGAPSAPVAPVVVPVQAPVPEEAAPVELPSIPVRASSKPASPPPAPAALADSAEFEPIGSGDVLGSVSVSGPQPSGPASADDPLGLLGDLLPPEAEPALPPVPAPKAAPAVSAAPPGVASAKMGPAAAEQKRKVSGTLYFAQPGDDAMIASGFKLQFRAPAPTSCFFSLIVKGKEWPELLSLELDTPKKVELPTKKGVVSITFTYKGANDIGQKRVDYAMEGGVEAVTQATEGFRKAGTVLRSGWKKLVQHLPEVIVTGFAVGLAVCGFTMGWIRNQLGVLHPYVTVAVPLAIASLATWTGFAREKDIRKEMEGSD